MNEFWHYLYCYEVCVHFATTLYLEDYAVICKYWGRLYQRRLA